MTYMQFTRLTSAILFLTLLPVAPLTAQQTAPGTVKISVDEVLLDLVVRDKKGKPITDLKPDEITVSDNGTKQTITSFRLVRGSEAISATGGATKLDPVRQIRLVTLAFENLGQIEQRKLARTAALDLIKQTDTPNTFFAVVILSGRLLALQQFTSDKKALEEAVNRATGGLSTTRLISESDRITNELQQVLGPQPGGNQSTAAASAATATSSPAGGAATGGFAEAAQQRMLSDIMLSVLRNEQGSAGNDTRMTLSALKSLITGMQALPGRKSIIYFTPGMYVPSELDVPFNNLVSLANRANTTFYMVDPRGVMVGTQNAGSASALSGAAMSAAATATRISGAVSREEALALDHAEGSARNNTSLKMRELADSTGGFLIGDSNDLRQPLQHISEEIASYYELSYNPGIQTYDGGFRKLSVAVSRKDAVIHSRNGYFALPPEARAMGLQTFELPLLQFLSQGEASEAVPFNGGAVLLRPGADRSSVSLLVEVPLHSLQSTEDVVKKTRNVHCSLAALVKDSSGQVVEKMTRDRSFQVTADQYKLGNFVEKNQISLPAGTYSLEVAVMDRESGKIGMKKSSFVVTSKINGVAISTMTPVRSYTPNTKDLSKDEPFQFQGGSITPTLDTRVIRGANNAVRLFFTVYADAAIGGKPELTIEFIQGGKTLVKTPLELPKADAEGRIPYVMTIPAQSIPPGVYQLRATATQGPTKAEARSVVRIEDAQ